MTHGGARARRVLVRSAEHVANAVVGPPRAQASPTASCSSASRSTASRTRPTRSCAARWRALFSEEKDPIAVIKWKEIYETLETATDRCEDVANIIEGVVLETRLSGIA